MRINVSGPLCSREKPCKCRTGRVKARGKENGNANLLFWVENGARAIERKYSQTENGTCSLRTVLVDNLRRHILDTNTGLKIIAVHRLDLTTRFFYEYPRIAFVYVLYVLIRNVLFTRRDHDIKWGECCGKYVFDLITCRQLFIGLYVCVAKSGQFYLTLNNLIASRCK